MQIKAKRVKEGFLIPFFDESLKNKESINVEIPLEELFTDEYIEKHWLELVMSSTDPSINDDERLSEAYYEYLKEKEGDNYEL